MGAALLLTGQPGVGKTTVLQAVIGRLEGRAAGFYTEEIREGGRRTGFRLVTLDGRRGILASVNRSGPYRVGKYRVHLDELDRIGVDALRVAVEQPRVSLVVIDEIGKMELFSQAFRGAVQAALDSTKPVLATVMARSHPWADRVKARSDTTLLRVTQANRNALPEQILSWLKTVWKVQGCC
jgi:nucleoside-triphosphatase